MNKIHQKLMEKLNPSKIKIESGSIDDHDVLPGVLITLLEEFTANENLISSFKDENLTRFQKVTEYLIKNEEIITTIQKDSSEVFRNQLDTIVTNHNNLTSQITSAVNEIVERYKEISSKELIAISALADVVSKIEQYNRGMNDKFQKSLRTLTVVIIGQFMMLAALSLYIILR
jgi:hypothetical protein